RADVVPRGGDQPPLEVGPRVDAGRAVALEIEDVAAGRVIEAPPDVVEADLVERGSRGVRRDVAADSVLLLVRLHDHRHRVPANDALDAAFQVTVAGIRGLLL